MIKKVFIVLTAVVTAIGLAACGETKEETPVETTQAETTVVETTVAETTAAVTETTSTEEKDAVEETKEGEDNNAEEPEAEKQEENKEAAAEDNAAVEPVNTLDEGYYGTVYTDGDGLMLRSGPDSSNEALAVVPDYEDLYIEAEQDGWGYTNYGGEYGWVYLGFIG